MGNVYQLPPNKQFHYFLSHKKTHSSLGRQMETVAQGIHDSLEAMGFSGFFDLDNLDRINKQELERNVKRSCSLVVLLHDETVDSEWCQFEWRIAQQNGIPAKCIVDTSCCFKQTVIDQLGKVAPHLLAYQIVEYSPIIRKQAVQKIATFLCDLRNDVLI